MIVYLDQNAIWELAINRKRCPHLERLRHILQKGHHDNLLLCPIPPETILETIGVESKQDRLCVYTLQCELASVAGQTIAFKAFNKLLEEDSLAMVRGQPRTSRFEPCFWHSVEDELFTEQNRPNIEQAKKMWGDGFTRLSSTLESCSLNAENASHGIRSEHAAHLLRQIEKLEKGLSPDRGDDGHLAYDLITYLTYQNVNSEELSRLKNAVINRRWEAIPVVFYRACLAAELEVRYRSPEG
jgi:hypothetical protein